ncbi:hypothetical protein PanWU01x14_150890 [Parasponia andersonii]|uniref:Uncharacterized protein n=1 Tax=Parasponia andersonii TaxID=3476 RepID=A0A2P5CI06_PARAD|nr:hypothetical protein PanWU01x14_150890 [Parasponia andersonii]
MQALAIVVYDRSLVYISWLPGVERHLSVRNEFKALKFALQFSSVRNWDLVDIISDSQEMVNAATIFSSPVWLLWPLRLCF